MNKVNIQVLLEQWTHLLVTGKKKAREKARHCAGGILGLIKRATGEPIIFDLKTYESQRTIQDSLCKELPQWAGLIRSQPEIMDGHRWVRENFIDLYFSHFDLVVEKLQRIIDEPLSV